MLLLLLVIACAPTVDDWTGDGVLDDGVLDDGVHDDGGSTTGSVEEEDPVEAALVVINELMADNESTVEDEDGHEDDWVELVLTGDVALNLSGWGMGQSEREWTFPSGTTLSPGEHLLLWADATDAPLHLPFTLPASEGELRLFDANDVVVDAVSWVDQLADVALGRFPDGGAFMAPTIAATPGNSNPWDPGQSLDPTEQLFPQDRVLELALTLPQRSLDALDDDPYTYVEGSVSFGAVTLSPVGIRIKGQWGSLRDIDQKAAFKVNMGSFGGTGELRGLEKLTLNNMVQDPSLINERLAYTLMRDLGVPAPRTAHVALTVNGEYRGIYLHVESPDERFLARWYDAPDGNLYEGEYGEDISVDGYLELDHDQQDPDGPDDYADLLVLAELLTQPPSEELAADFEGLVDVDEWAAALAAEVAIGHWDGYFWYPNNYRLYRDPTSGRFALLPWGVDQTFGYEGDVEDADGSVAEWMLAVPSLRARYLRALWRAAERMEALGLDQDAIETHAMVLPYLQGGPYEEYSAATSRDYLRSTVDFVQTRPAQLQATLFR